MLNDELVSYTLKNGETINSAYEINKDTLKCSWYQMSEENSSNIIYVEKDWLTIEEIKTETELNYRDILNFTLNVGDFLLYEDNPILTIATKINTKILIIFFKLSI